MLFGLAPAEEFGLLPLLHGEGGEAGEWGDVAVVLYPRLCLGQWASSRQLPSQIPDQVQDMSGIKSGT
jgi:hypothetical protein